MPYCASTRPVRCGLWQEHLAPPCPSSAAPRPVRPSITPPPAHLRAAGVPLQQAVVRQVRQHAHVARLQLVGRQQVPQAVRQALGHEQGWGVGRRPRDEHDTAWRTKLACDQPKLDTVR